MIPAVSTVAADSTAAANSGAGISAAFVSGFEPGAKAAAAPTPFADLITDAVGQVNQLQEQANTTVRGLMTGADVDVHQAMIATEKASMAFELALAVRNKAVQAYESVMGMQF
jgi:flagellar hook-basal body complex protein FliE